MSIYKHVLEAEADINKLVIYVISTIEELANYILTYQADDNDVTDKYVLRHRQSMREISRTYAAQYRENIDTIKSYLDILNKDIKTIKELPKTNRKTITKNSIAAIKRSIIDIRDKSNSIIDMLNPLNLRKLDYAYLSATMISSGEKGPVPSYDAGMNPDIIKKITLIETACLAEIKRICEKNLSNIIKDEKLLEAIESNKSFKDYFNFSHIRKIDLVKDFGNKKVTIQLINRVNFSKDMIAGIVAEDFVDSFCRYELTKPGCSDEFEVKLLQAKNMSSKNLEETALNILKNTVLKILEEDNTLIKNTVSILHIELVPKNNITEGEYISKKSNSSYISINIMLSIDFLYPIVQKKEFLDSKSNTYQTIIHELTHNYDSKLNSLKQDHGSNGKYSSLTDTTSYKTFNNSVAKLKEILFALREEGLAKIKGILEQRKSILDSSDNIIPIFLDYDYLVSQFRTDMYNDKISYKEMYDSGTLHELGRCMAMLMFIDNCKIKFTFSKYKDYFPITSEYIKNAKIDIKFHASQLLNKEGFYIVGNIDQLKKELNLFVTKLSLMSPEIFLEDYERTCKNFKITPILTDEDFKNLIKLEEKKGKNNDADYVILHKSKLF